MLYAAKGFRDFSNEVFGNCGYPNTLLANSVQNQNSLAVLFPKINKFSNLENWFAIILFPHDTLQFNIFSITFSSRFDESRGDFLFYIFFSKNTPPILLCHFKQVEGYFTKTRWTLACSRCELVRELKIFEENTLTFSSPSSNKWGVKFFKVFFAKVVKKGVHFSTACANEWRGKFFQRNFCKTVQKGCAFWCCLSK